MNIIQILDRFQFYHYRSFNKQIEPVSPYFYSFILYRYFNLLFYLQTPLV